ncbi:hypothetical protein AB0J72_27490 [Dactylosporangium sp. NPDC049742]
MAFDTSESIGGYRVSTFRVIVPALTLRAEKPLPSPWSFRVP